MRHNTDALVVWFSEFLPRILKDLQNKEDRLLDLKDLDDFTLFTNAVVPYIQDDKHVLNIAMEEDRKAFGSAMFKAIVTGDPIQASFKHRDFFYFKPYCKMAFSSNHLPNVADSSHGFYRRILGIEFTRQFLGKDADKHLEDKLKEEIEGIFKWAYAGLLMLKKYDGFLESDKSNEFIKNYKMHNNPALTFIDECLDIDESQTEWREPCKDLYQKYAEYARSLGNKPMNDQNFGSMLKGLKVKRGKVNNNLSRVNAYIGVKYLDPEPPAPGYGEL